MDRPLVYDASHLIARLSARYPTGIDRVDIAFARYFCSLEHGRSFGAIYGKRDAICISLPSLRQILDVAENEWREDTEVESDQLGNPTNNGLQKGSFKDENASKKKFFYSYIEKSRRLLLPTLLSQGLKKFRVPSHAIYVNVAQFKFEYPGNFEWLQFRKDVTAVLYIHDLLPLDYPEYFPSGYRDVFIRRVNTAASFGKAFLVSTNSVRNRLEEELNKRGYLTSKIHVAPLASPLPPLNYENYVSAAEPYFVLISTIEPRKNHLLILHIWREFAKKLPENKIPKIFFVGGRGWEYEQVADMLDRSPVLQKHVVELSRLPNKALSELIAGARAVLMPSFDEGYGLPIVEALSHKTPVIASDIPAFREITQGCATLISPIDGVGWSAAILNALDNPLSTRPQSLEFNPPNWRDYFQSLEAFLNTIV